jgi:hypothetical protein
MSSLKRMEKLEIALAEYIAVLGSRAASTSRAEDRGRYERHLAQAALMYAALKKHASIGMLKELVASERRSYGWDFLGGPEGILAESSFNEFAELVERSE